MPDAGISYGTVTGVSSTSITIADSGGNSGIYYGSFSYSSAGYLTGGTMAGYDSYIHYALAYQARLFNLDALTVTSYLNSSNSLAFYQYALTGNDIIDGGAGTDSVIYRGNLASYVITKTSTGYTVADSVSGRDGSDTLINVERLQFSDKSIAFDTSGDAGQAYRLYQAAFNRTPDVGGLGFQMKTLDAGWPLAAVAQNFIDSPEFVATYGALNSTDFVQKMYHNVLHRIGAQSELDYYVPKIDSGTMTRAAVLVGFSESPENQAAVIGVIQNGMIYTV